MRDLAKEYNLNAGEMLIYYSDGTYSLKQRLSMHLFAKTAGDKSIDVIVCKWDDNLIIETTYEGTGVLHSLTGPAYVSDYKGNIGERYFIEAKELTKDEWDYKVKIKERLRGTLLEDKY